MLSKGASPDYHVWEEFMPPLLIICDLPPCFSFMLEVLVHWPLPTPRAKPSTMQLGSVVMFSHSLYPIPIFIFQDLVSESRRVGDSHSPDFTRPQKYKPMVQGVPRFFMEQSAVPQSSGVAEDRFFQQHSRNSKKNKIAKQIKVEANIVE